MTKGFFYDQGMTTIPEPRRQEIEDLLAEIEKITSEKNPRSRKTRRAKKSQGRAGIVSPMIVGITGPPRSGKDLLIDYLQESYERINRLNFSDSIITEVNAYLEEGGIGQKINSQNKNDPIQRRLLQEWGLGRFLEESDYWSSRVKKQAQKIFPESDLLLISGVRSPADFQMINDLGGQIWRVVRPGNRYQAEHPIEDFLLDFPPDREIINPVEGQRQAFFREIERTLDSYRP